MKSIPDKIYLAPIRGITNQSFRNAFARQFPGFDRAIAPFVTVGRGCQAKKSAIADLVPAKETGIETVPQVLTGSAPELVQMASLLFEMGHPCVNWNLGCPHPPVIKKKKGAGLLPYPEEIERILDDAVPKLGGRLSIKMRLGRDSADEIARLMPILNRYPLEEIIIHPRTAVQLYSGQVNLDAFASCLDILDHLLVYNGNIDSLDGFIELQKRFPSVSHWMIGRGALHNPFLIPSIKRETNLLPSQKEERIKRFHDELFDVYSTEFSGPAHLLDHMKALWNYLASCFINREKIVKKIRKTKSVAQYQSVVHAIFEPLPNGATQMKL